MFLSGYKTYIIGALYIAVVSAEALGYLSKELADTIKGILLGTGAITMRAAMAKTY